MVLDLPGTILRRKVTSNCGGAYFSEVVGLASFYVAPLNFFRWWYLCQGKKREGLEYFKIFGKQPGKKQLENVIDCL